MTLFMNCLMSLDLMCIMSYVIECNCAHVLASVSRDWRGAVLHPRAWAGSWIDALDSAWNQRLLNASWGERLGRLWGLAECIRVSIFSEAYARFASATILLEWRWSQSPSGNDFSWWTDSPLTSNSYGRVYTARHPTSPSADIHIDIIGYPGLAMHVGFADSNDVGNIFRDFGGATPCGRFLHAPLYAHDEVFDERALYMNDNPLTQERAMRLPRRCIGMTGARDEFVLTVVAEAGQMTIFIDYVELRTLRFIRDPLTLELLASDVYFVAIIDPDPNITSLMLTPIATMLG